MKPLIVYSSYTGFSEKYANWLAPKIDGDVIKLDDFNEFKLKDRKQVIMIGSVHMGRIHRMSKFLYNYKNHEVDELYLVGVGAAPFAQEIIENLKVNHKKDELKVTEYFYLPGGIDYKGMRMIDEFLMKLFAKNMLKKAKKGEFDMEWAQKLQTSYDISDEKYLEPIVNAIKTTKE